MLDLMLIDLFVFFDIFILVLVGFSGGLDLIVLLYWLVVMFVQCVVGLCVLYVYYGLQVVVDGWVDYCWVICVDWEILLQVIYVDVVCDSGQGLEVVVCNVCCDVFVYVLCFGECLVLVYYCDDQVEIFLLCVLCGLGVDGLVVIQVYVGFVVGLVWCLLLQVLCSVLFDYVCMYGLYWIDDFSNVCDDVDCNFLCLYVMLLLQ